jgi:hypothetical protein
MESVHVMHGASTSLSCDIHPPIEVDSSKEIQVGLLRLTTYNNIPNIINAENNIFYYATQENKNYEEMNIPEGSYSIPMLNNEIKRQLKLKQMTGKFDLRIDVKTLKCEIKTSLFITFNKLKSFGHLLGFKNMLLQPNNAEYIQGNEIVKIMDVNLVSVEIGFAKGAYNNGVQGHSIYQFSPRVPVGYKIDEVPIETTYYPVNKRRIDKIEVDLRDQNGILINLRGETVTIVLKLKILDKEYGSSN